MVANAAKTSSPGSPGPCSTDCSGLVSIAVDQAFNQTYLWVVHGTMSDQSSDKGAQYWKSIPMSQVQPGDIVTTPDHVAIVTGYDASNGGVSVFQAPYTGHKIGPASDIVGYFTQAFHWTGPGS